MGADVIALASPLGGGVISRPRKGLVGRSAKAGLRSPTACTAEAVVVDLPVAKANSPGGHAVRQVRAKYGLSLAQAAAAAAVSPSRVEEWERGAAAPPGISALRKQYGAYAEAKARCSDSNLLLKAVPMRLARQMLGVSLKEIAAGYGYKPSTWLRFEADARVLPEAVKDDLQDRLRTMMRELCK